MMDEISESPIANDEWVARYILFKSWICSDKKIRANAFMPYPHSDLSVTRHIGLSEPELWGLGQAVANLRSLTLHGRADVLAVSIRKQSLEIQPSPPPRNHANIIGWPKEKQAQKVIALKIADAARYTPAP
ncbi:MAG: hypothetical protein NTX50_28230 [Candidatus Sumerlaeota bacterium]|nr:hypothetical protein [Candidatus Sumerlaeota bacterium]